MKKPLVLPPPWRKEAGGHSGDRSAYVCNTGPCLLHPDSRPLEPDWTGSADVFFSFSLLRFLEKQSSFSVATDLSLQPQAGRFFLKPLDPPGS